jgi:hypothetical protein
MSNVSNCSTAPRAGACDTGTTWVKGKGGERGITHTGEAPASKRLLRSVKNTRKQSVDRRPINETPPAHQASRDRGSPARRSCPRPSRGRKRERGDCPQALERQERSQTIPQAQQGFGRPREPSPQVLPIQGKLGIT